MSQDLGGDVVRGQQTKNTQKKKKITSTPPEIAQQQQQMYGAWIKVKMTKKKKKKKGAGTFSSILAPAAQCFCSWVRYVWSPLSVAS